MTTLNTRIGNVSMAIEVGEVKDLGKVIENAVKKLSAHDAASATFKKDKAGVGHDRKDAYSAALGAAAKAAMTKALETMFYGVSVETSAYVAPAKAAASLTSEQLVQLATPGADVAALLAAWGMTPKATATGAGETPASELTEADDVDLA